MLDTMRQHRRNQIMKIGVYVIFAVLIFIFAVSFGPGSFAHQGRGGMGTMAHAAVVNGNVITTRELDMTYGNYVDELRQRSGRPLNLTSVERHVLKRRILNALIDEELVSEHAATAGIRVSDKELRSHVENMPAFRRNGHFDVGYYKRFVSNVLGSSPEHFESEVRQQLIHQKVMAVLAAGVHVTKAEVRQHYVDTHDKVNVAYVRISPIAFESQVKAPAKAAVTAFLKDHMDEVKSFYARNQFRYESPKKVHARHILIKVASNATAAQKAAALKKAQGILAKLKAGADFAKLAKADSDDTHSKAQGGDLGWFGPGTMVHALEAAAMSTPKGQLYPKVIKSDLGYHILQVLDVQPAKNQTLAEVKTDIATTLLKRAAAKKLAQAKATAVLAEVQGGKAPSAVAPKAASDAGGASATAATTDSALVSGQTGLVTIRGGYIPGIGRSTAVAQAIHGLSAAKPVLGRVVTVDSEFYVLRLVKHQPPDMTAFAKNEADLAAQLRDARVSQVQEAWVKSLRTGATIQINDKVVNS